MPYVKVEGVFFLFSIIIWLSVLETEKMRMWKWVWSIKVQQWRLQTFSAARETRARDIQRQGRRAMLKDILPCPFGLGLEIDIFQSDECLMWVILPLHHCDMQLLANSHPCWWAHPMPQGPWLTYPPTFLSPHLCLPRSAISVLLFLLPFSPVFCHHVMSNHCLAGEALSRAGREQEP